MAKRMRTTVQSPLLLRYDKHSTSQQGREFDSWGYCKLLRCKCKPLRYTGHKFALIAIMLFRIKFLLAICLRLVVLGEEMKHIYILGMRSAGLIKVILSDQHFRRILFPLLVCDVLFILMHIAVLIITQFWQAPEGIFDPTVSLKFRIDHEHSYSEIFEYFKSVLCIVGLMSCYSQTRDRVYIALAAINTLLFADNAFGLHEHIGGFLQQEFPSIGQNKGEFIAFMIYLVAVTGLLWSSFPTRTFQNAAYAVGCLSCIGVIAFFAVGIDVLTAVVPRAIPHTYEAFTLMEDGGELIGLSLNLAFICSVAKSLRRCG